MALVVPDVDRAGGLEGCGGRPRVVRQVARRDDGVADAVVGAEFGGRHGRHELSCRHEPPADVNGCGWVGELTEGRDRGGDEHRQHLLKWLLLVVIGCNWL